MTNDTPLVSVIMPVYNAGAYLEPAVASILAQTLTDWELIAIDDASTDGSYEYLQSIDDPRVRVLRNDRNMKQSYTQNRGIDLARGKYIARMDADDLSAPTRLEKQVRTLEADPSLDVISCGNFQVTETLEIVAVKRPPVSHEEITRWCMMNFHLTHGSMVGKAEWFRKWRANPKVRLAQDFEFLFRSHRQSRFANVPEPLYVYRHAGVTFPLRQRFKSVYYKCYALAINGFRMGIPLKTLLGLASMAPRPLLYTLKWMIGSRTGLTKTQGEPPSPDDVRVFRETLAQLAQVRVPRKGQGCA